MQISKPGELAGAHSGLMDPSADVKICTAIVPGEITQRPIGL